MQKYEFCYLYMESGKPRLVRCIPDGRGMQDMPIDYDSKANTIATVLAQLGLDGWQLASVRPAVKEGDTSYFYFQRPMM